MATDKWRVYYKDLDNDGYSEEIHASVRDVNSKEATFIIYDQNGDLLDQWSFGTDIIASDGQYLFSDLDGNGYKEISFISQSSDSAILNIIEPIDKNGINREGERIFIDRGREYNNQVHIGYPEIILSFNSEDNVQELYFTLMQGYAGYLRNVFKYNPKHGTIEKSAHLTNITTNKVMMDLNDNGFKEMVFSQSSNGNQLDTAFTKRSDYSLWLNVLDKDLKFLFQPVEIKVPFSFLHSLPFENKGTAYILSYLDSRSQEVSKSKLMIFSPRGDLIKEKELESGEHQVFVNPEGMGFITYNVATGELRKINFDLETYSSFSLEAFSKLHLKDMDLDGQQEWIVIPFDQKKMSIYRSNLKDFVSFKSDTDEAPWVYFGGIKTQSGNEVFIQKGRPFYILDYAPNQYYYLNFLSLPAVYGLILLIVLAIIKGQNIRLGRQRAIEVQISELQIKTIKNQVDPHFVFNSINTISEMMLTDNKLEADRFISKFSNMMRGTLEKSDKIVSSLNDELLFTENFIQLQQLRFNHNFQYKVDVDKAVDMKASVPKHVLYSYVENAIKHGLSNTKEGLLTITINYTDHKLQLIIEDNGGGLGSAKATERNSTGSGIDIMQQIYDLYAKLNKTKIQYHIDNVKGVHDKICGTRVVVEISK